MLFYPLLLILSLNRALANSKLDKIRTRNTVNYRLHRDLLEGYRRTTRPVEHASKPVEVEARTALYQLINLDQAANTILLAGSFEFFWYDKYLQWSPENYEGASSIYLDSGDIWIPELSLYYSHHHSTSKVVLLTNNNVKVNYTGHVRYYIPFTTESLCPTNVKSFPFDGQSCSLFFGSWAHNNESITYTIQGEDKLDLRDYYDNQEWELVEEKSKIKEVLWYYADFVPPQTWTVLELTVVTRRTSFYYVFNLVIPSTIIALVAVIGFHMPSNSGRILDAKFRLGINTLLSMSLILLVIVEDMPHFSMTGNDGKRGPTSGVPLIGLFYFSLLVIIGLSTITTSLFVLLQRSLRIRKTLPWYFRWLTLGCRSHHNISTAGYTPAPLSSAEPIQRTLEHSKKLAISQYENLAVFNHFYGILEDICYTVKSTEFALEGIREELVSLAPKDDFEYEGNLVIRRLQMISLVFYLALISTTLLMFFYHETWYA